MKTNAIPRTNIIILSVLNTCQSINVFNSTESTLWEAYIHQKLTNIRKHFLQPLHHVCHAPPSIQSHTLIPHQCIADFSWSIIDLLLEWLDRKYEIGWRADHWTMDAAPNVVCCVQKIISQINTYLIFLKIYKSCTYGEEGPCNLKHWYY